MVPTPALLLLLVATGGAAQNTQGCEVLTLGVRTFSYLLTEAPILLTLPPLPHSVPVSGIDLLFSTPEEDLSVHISNSSYVRCKKGSRARTYLNIPGMAVKLEGWWRVEVRVEEGQVLVGGVRMCGRLRGAEPTLRIRAKQRRLVAVNCDQDCMEMDNSAITTLPSLSSRTAIHVKANSQRSRATLQVLFYCNATESPWENNELRRVKLVASDLDGKWQRLRVISQILHDRGPFFRSYGGLTPVIIVQAGNKVKVFHPRTRESYEGPYALRDEHCEQLVDVLSSEDMTWAIGCNESHFRQIWTQTSTCTDSSGAWKALAVASIMVLLLIFLAGCVFMAVIQRRELERRRTTNNVTVEFQTAGRSASQANSTSIQLRQQQHQTQQHQPRQSQQDQTQQQQQQQRPVYCNQPFFPQGSSGEPSKADEEGHYYDISDLPFIRMQYEQQEKKKLAQTQSHL